MEQSCFWEANNSSVGQETPSILPSSQQLATGPCFESNETSPYSKWGLLDLLRGMGKFGKIWSADGQNAIQYTERRMSKCTYNFMYNFMYNSLHHVQ
jgi:hypothetical protein